MRVAWFVGFFLNIIYKTIIINLNTRITLIKNDYISEERPKIGV